ncbi:MAG: hypothetical protein ACTSPK_03655 [Candidatus Heimdallarchaeota archaeon]
MSQNINKVNVQIPGTTYNLQLAEDRGRWVLSLLLRGDVENEVVIPVFSKNGIQKGANELLKNSRLTIDPYPLQNVCSQLFNSAESSLPTPAVGAQEEVAVSEDMPGVKQKLDYLETTLNNVTEELKESIDGVTASLTALETERVSRLEAEIANGGGKSGEDMYANLVGRIDKIEESLAETKGDDRVPSILTAIDALETKVSQIEGAAVTGASPAVAVAAIGTSENVGSLKDDIGRLSVAFDRITQRLTDLELRLNAISPPAAAPEGAAPVVKTPEPTPTPTKVEPPHIDDKPKLAEE